MTFIEFLYIFTHSSLSSIQIRGVPVHPLEHTALSEFLVLRQLTSLIVPCGLLLKGRKRLTGGSKVQFVACMLSIWLWLKCFGLNQVKSVFLYGPICTAQKVVESHSGHARVSRRLVPVEESYSSRHCN